METLKGLLGRIEKVDAVEMYAGIGRKVVSRHKSYEVDGRYLIQADVGMTKPELYGHVLCGLLSDQLAAIRDPGHTRRVTEENGLTSLEMAAAATDLASS